MMGRISRTAFLVVFAFAASPMLLALGVFRLFTMYMNPVEALIASMLIGIASLILIVMMYLQLAKRFPFFFLRHGLTPEVRKEPSKKDRLGKLPMRAIGLIWDLGFFSLLLLSLFMMEIDLRVIVLGIACVFWVSLRIGYVMLKKE